MYSYSHVTLKNCNLKKNVIYSKIFDEMYRKCKTFSCQRQKN